MAEIQEKKQPGIKELLAQAEALQAKIAQLRTESKQTGIQQIRDMMVELDIRAEDLDMVEISKLPAGKGRTGHMWQRAVQTGALPPMYRDPASGRTWSGRGRVPDWMPEDRGARDDYLIK